MAKKTTQPAATAAPVEPKHLCDTCAELFPECEPGKVVYGIDRDPAAKGAAADRVLERDTYHTGDEPAHHPFGMSAWPALCLCASYCGSSVETKLGAKGTASHEALATGESSGDEGLDAAAKWARVEIGKLFEQYPPEGDAHDEMKVTFHKEHLPAHLAVLDGVFGTSDLCWRDVDGGMHAADYKTFSRKIEEHLPQLAGYALAAYPHAETVTLHVIAGGIRQVKSFTFSRAQLVSVAEVVATAMVMGHTLPRCAGDHCTYCGHKADCKTYSDWATTDLAGAESTTEILPLLATDAFIRANPVAAARFLAWWQKFSKVAKETNDRIKAAIIGGATVADLEAGVNWIVKEVNGPAKDVALSEVLKACDGDIPDGWEERMPVSKTAAVTAFGDRVASVFPVPTQNRLMKEKL